MTVDTKGFVLTKEKEPFKIWSIIKDSIYNEIKKETGIDDITCVWGENYTMPNCQIADFAKMLTVHFVFAGESRQLSVHLDCDHDFEERKKGKKIIFSLGAWGHSVQLIECVLRGFADYGKLHMIDDDCNGEWREVLPFEVTA